MNVAVKVAALLLLAAPAAAQAVLPAVPALPGDSSVARPAFPPAQTPLPQGTPAQAPVFRAGSELVALNVAVQDGSSYVGNLQPADFAVYEDGVKQNVRFFESTAVPIDLIVLLDTSASMTDKIDQVHTAASGFLHTLRRGDRGAVVAFNDNVTVLQALTGDVARLDAAVQSTHAHGGTSLYNAVYIALKEFGHLARQDTDVRRQAIVVLSDGNDTTSLVSFDDVLALAHQMGVNIYTVSLQSKIPEDQPLPETPRYFSESDYAMKTLARETGAESFFPRPSDLRTIYGAIAADLAHQYSLGYVPFNTRNDARFRRVIVQIITHPSLHARTRQGYTLSAR